MTREPDRDGPHRLLVREGGSRPWASSTRALRLVVRFGLEELGLGRLELITDPDNVASQRVAEKVGLHARRRFSARICSIPTDAAATRSCSRFCPASSAEQRPRLERDELTRLCYWMLGLWGFLLYALGPALPALREQLDVSRAVVSLHTTLIAVGAIAVGIAGDRFVVRVGRRAAFWVAAGGIASGALLLAAGGNLAVTLPAAALLGIAGALVVTTLQAALADRHGPLAPVALVEANAIATGLGVLALVAVAVAIWAGSDWRAVFVAAALLAVPAMAIAYGSVCFPAAPELPHDHEPGLPRPYWFYWFALLLFVAIEFCVVFWSTDYLESERGLSDSSAAAASSVFLIGMTVGRALGGPLTRRFGSERLIAVALAVAAAGFVVFWLVPSSTSRSSGSESRARACRCSTR